MSIFVIGVNHKTASIQLREQIYFPADKLTLYLKDLLSQGHAEEAVLLSTCNRSELYCETSTIDYVTNWFYSQTTLDAATLARAAYCYQDEKALAHMMHVACGLDSMVLGESQILGQMKAAFSESCAASTIGPSFHRLFQQIFSIAKNIRTTTAVGACPVSVASAATALAKGQVEELALARVALIGAGETSALMLKYLQAHGVRTITLVNRTLENASELLENFSGQIYGLNKLPAALAEADIVFSATGSPMPIIQAAMIKDVMHVRKDKRLILIDIAVPRDIEAQVSLIPNVLLYCIDDLKTIIEQNHHGRRHAAIKAKEMIEASSANLIAELNSIDRVTHAIRAYRGQIEEICRLELLKAKRRLHQGAEPALVLDAFAHAFTKKLLHAPSIQLRQAGAEGRFELLRLAKQLYSIPDVDIERL